MSIVERALGRVRDDGSATPIEREAKRNTELLGEDVVAVSTLSAALVPVRTVRMRVDESEPIGAFWAGKAETAILNQFRGIRREILTLLNTRTNTSDAPIILFTSPLPGDGKTFVSVATSRMLAGAPDSTVFLHDFDLIRRATSGLFGAEEASGVIECLSEQAQLRRVVCATDYPRLNLVPAGNGPGETREMLIGPRLKQFVDELQATGPKTVHLLDAPPVLSVVEIALLAEQVDIVILVVRSRVTPASAVKDALEKIGSKSRVCVVLNGISRSSAADYSDYADYGPIRR